MPGTKAGSLKAVKTIKRKYGENYFGRIGAIGGKLGRTGGFFADRELARIAGTKGGRVGGRGRRKES